MFLINPINKFIEKEKERVIFKINVEPEIPQFPKVPREQVNIRYALLAPYAYAHIYWDKKNYEIVYEVERLGMTLLTVTRVAR